MGGPRSGRLRRGSVSHFTERRTRSATTVWWDIAAEVRAEWEDWHTREHMPERLSVPGFLRGTRWIAESGQPSYFVLYEAERVETITGGAYLERLNNPTPCSLKMMPHHRNMVRSLCEVRATWGGGVPQTLATIRFSLTADLPELAPRSRRSAAAMRLPPGCCWSAATTPMP